MFIVVCVYLVLNRSSHQRVPVRLLPYPAVLKRDIVPRFDSTDLVIGGKVSNRCEGEISRSVSMRKLEFRVRCAKRL